MLLRRTLARIPSNLDKREGSVIYLAVAPMIVELAQAYIQMDVILQETFADTASREYLIRRAAERGLEPYPATCAVLRGTFDCDVPIGSRFYIDTLHYTVIEKEAAGTYRLQCEEPGEEGNTRFGQMIPVEYITGLKKAELTELLIPGTAEEDTEVFRERYFASFDSLAFGGNRADYKEKVMGLGGVGDVKVYRATAEDGSPMAGHVKIVVLDASWDIPDEVLLEEIQELIRRGYSQTAAQAIGYKEFFDYLQGNGTLEEAVARVQQESRRYAKRQLTWFRRDKRVNWLYIDDYEDYNSLITQAFTLVKEQLKTSNGFE